MPNLGLQKSTVKTNYRGIDYSSDIPKLRFMTAQPIIGKVPEVTIAERLYMARTIAGYDKQQLAELIGISDATVLNYEKRDYGHNRRPKTLRDWADACGMNRGWLITGEPSPDSPGPGLRLVAGTGFEPVTSGSCARVIELHPLAAPRPLKEAS